MTLHMWVSKETGWYNSGAEDNEPVFKVQITDGDDVLASNDISPAQVPRFLKCNPEEFLHMAIANYVIRLDQMDELLKLYQYFVVNGQTFEKKIVTSVQFDVVEN